MRMLFLVIVALCMVSVASAQSDLQRLKHFNTNKNVAAGGYDVTTYFDIKPLHGSADFTFIHKGIIYLFASNANLNEFKSNIEKYEPAYGGWCAFAMGSSGEKVRVDPETYKILNGKIYLFYNFWGNNTLKDWNENEKTLKEAADRHWQRLITMEGD